MTANLLRPDWATTPAEVGGRPRGVRSFDLPDAGDHVPTAQPVHDSAWVAGYRDGRDQGVQEGRDEGLLQGRAEGRAEAMAAGQAALTGLDARFEALRQEHADQLECVAADTVALALEIAEMVLGHQVAAAKDPGAEALTRALTVLRPTGKVLARLHPDDLELLGGPPPGVQVELIPDHNVGRGGCLLDSGASRVDATLESALSRVREVLAPSDDEETS
jgi:flagellar assembly protein FliH